MKAIGIQLWIYRQWIELTAWVRQKMLVSLYHFKSDFFFFFFSFWKTTGVLVVSRVSKEIHFFVAFGRYLASLCGISIQLSLSRPHGHTRKLELLDFVKYLGFSKLDFFCFNFNCNAYVPWCRLLSTDLFVKRQLKRRFFREQVRKILCSSLL
jgi:hypothetical protein